jgi:hypothetical protein
MTSRSSHRAASVAGAQSRAVDYSFLRFTPASLQPAAEPTWPRGVSPDAAGRALPPCSPSCGDGIAVGNYAVTNLPSGCAGCLTSLYRELP